LFLAMVFVAARASAGEPIPKLMPLPESPVAPISADDPEAQLGWADFSPDRCACPVEIGTMDAPRRSTFVEALVGGYRSSLGPEIPRFEYMPIVFRYGWRHWEDRGPIARRISFLAELTVDPVTDGFGNFMVGPSVMVRFDACPDRRLCPYLQAGTGFLLNDAYRDQNQRAIGANFEFLQQVEVGLRWKLTDCLAIQSEFGIQHISNAGLAGRNLGVNALGASVGLHWDFGGRR
jgi:hypothetical protein